MSFRGSSRLLTGCLSWLLPWSLGAQQCFDDAIAEAQRKNLVNLDLGTQYPVGVWANDWAAGNLTSTMAMILIQEKLGYRAEKKGPGPLALDGFYAVTGCTTPTDSTDRGCGPTTTYVHVNVEVWTATYQGTWDEIQSRYSQMAPKNLGNMGYYGATAMYVPSAVQARAYDAEGLHLDFYRDYNATRENAHTYFASPADLNVSFLYQCNETALMLDEVTQNYLNLTGDSAGVEVSSGGASNITYNMKCFDTYFWYAPRCRSVPSSCLTWFTGGQGWGMFEMLVKATSYDMPLATAVASSFSNYAALPLSYDMMLYWWVPDPTFLRLTPRKITFPEHDSDAWAREDRRTAARDVSIEKHVSQDLSDLAPEVEQLIAGLSMSIEKVNSMLLDQLNTADTDFQVACRWLVANKADWSSWLPENGKCYSQFGMYNEQTQQFLMRREGAQISCRACPSGYYSSRLDDAQGITYVCKPCESGFFQQSGASISCKPCPLGSYQNDTASISCRRCPVGQYQDQEGSSSCKACPPGTGTFLLGSVAVTECGCEEGSINTGSPGDFQCVPCRNGLDCPFASTLATLKSGQSADGLNPAPKIKAGFYATEEEPLDVLQCRPLSNCPGGLPGMCSGGLEGHPCAVCPLGQTMPSGRCEDCGAATALWAVAIPISALWPIVAYYFTNLEVLAQPTPLKASVMALGIGASCLQSVAVFGLMSIQWPPSFEATSSNLQIVLLDLDALSASCVSGTNPMVRYLLSLAIFPVFVLWLLTCFCLSWLVRKAFQFRAWKIPYTLNTAGLGLQLGYGTMAAVAMKPLMCYQHPTGRQSMVIYPNFFCGETDHHLMQAAGLIFCAVFVVGFFGYCCYAAWNMPKWCASQQIFRVQCFRFFLANFRFDAHWFILLVLLRGLGFALSAVVGTNVPPAQSALASLILTVYGLTQAVMLPWKVPMINVADMLVNATLLLLINRGIQVDLALESQFAEIMTVCMFVFLLSTVILATSLSVLALILKLFGLQWQPILTLGNARNHQQISKNLRDCAKALLEVDEFTLAEKVAMANIYDVKTLATSIDLTIELLSETESFKLVSQTSFSQGRVRKTAVNSRLSIEESLMLGLVERNTGQSLDTREFNQDLENDSPKDQEDFEDTTMPQDVEDPLQATSF